MAMQVLQMLSKAVDPAILFGKAHFGSRREDEGECGEPILPTFLKGWFPVLVVLKSRVE